MRPVVFSIVLLYSGIISAVVPPADKDALIALYNSTNGVGWTNNTNWLSGDPCDNSWHGVECPLGDFVSAVLLNNNGLSGTIPPGIGGFTELHNLNLWYNPDLTGPIPTEIGNLASLEVLNLEGNSLSGSIPSSLGGLINLKILDLPDNQLSGEIPSSLGGLSSLHTMRLYLNQLEGSIPPELGTLPNLQMLWLDRNQLTGSIPPQLADNENLWDIKLFDNRLSGPIPVELGSMTILQSLWLSSNQLSGPVPPELLNLNALTVGGFDWNKLYTDDPAIDAFLNSKSTLSGNWSATQTIAPVNVSVAEVNQITVDLTWDAIEYTGDGGRYRVWFSTTPGGPYFDGGTTASKNDTSLLVSGLDPGTSYYFVVQTETDSHPDNQSKLISEFSNEVAATTLRVDLVFKDGFEQPIERYEITLDIHVIDNEVPYSQ